MSTIIDLYNQAQLALAAYSNLNAGISGSTYINALESNGQSMSTAQATQFASNWRVIDQYNHSAEVPLFDAQGNFTGFQVQSNGLSATVFEEVVNGVATGNCYLAIRGTEDLADLGTDILDIAILGYAAQQAQYQSLKTQVQTWLNNGTLASSFTVTGHSLGGFLAGALTVDFPINISHAYLYNAPGIGGLGASLSVGLQSLLGLAAQPTLNLSQVSNIRADAGLSPIAGLGTSWGTAIPIAIENQFLSDEPDAPAALNHSQQILTDSLALYNTLKQLDPSLSMASYKALLNHAAQGTAASYERIIDGLQATLGIDNGSPAALLPYGNHNRDALYTALYALHSNAVYTALLPQANGPAKVTLQSSSNLSASQARSDFGSFLALQYLTPFVLHPNDAAALTVLETAQLDLATRFAEDQIDTATKRAHGSLNYSDQWLADRAAYLKILNEANSADTDQLPVPGNRVTVYSAPGHVDIGTAPQNGSVPDAAHYIRFGSDTLNEALVGASLADHLYGGNGEDTLNGLAGNDYLEGNAGNDTLDGGAGIDTLLGGAGDDGLSGGSGDNRADTLNGGDGNDTYRWNAGNGLDTIIDSDGQGHIVWGADASGTGGITLGNGKKRKEFPDDAVWISSDGHFRYVLNGTTLTATHLTNGLGDGNVIVVQNFASVANDHNWRAAA